MIRSAALFATTSLVACGAPPQHRIAGRAPDAVLVAEGPPSEALSLHVVRPTVWADDDGATIIDDRITIALVDDDAATWRASARMDVLQALSLVSDLDAAIARLDDAPGGPPIVIESHEVPEGLAAGELCLIDGGRWSVSQDAETTIRLAIVDGRGDQRLRVATDINTARALRRQLALIARTMN